MLENMLLRQQLIVLKRQVKRTTLTWRDRTLFVLLASRLRKWKHALVIVQPDTVVLAENAYLFETCCENPNYPDGTRFPASGIGDVQRWPSGKAVPD